jgi:tetratricopeptide (TPR) repeat protein
MRRLTKTHYRQAIALHLKEMERLRRSGFPESSQIPSLVSLGNMHWEFGDLDEARPYFERAIALSRKAGNSPAPAVAYWLWKAGDIPAMEEECRSVVARYQPELQDVESAQVTTEDKRRKAMLASWKLAEANFLLREYSGALEWSKRARDLVPGAIDQEGLSRLAEGILAMDRGRYEAGLRLLRSLFGKWPDFLPGPSDLYRRALYLCHEVFGSAPGDLMAEDPAPEKWHVLLKRSRATPATG